MLTFVLFVGGGLAVLLLIAGVFVTVSGERSIVEDRLEHYLDEGQPSQEFIGDDDGERTSFLTDWINSFILRSSYGERISKELARADLKFKPGEYVALMVISSFVSGVFGYYFAAQSLVFFVLFAIFGLFIPRMFVKRQQGIRLKTFNEQLPDMLNLIVNGLRAGFSTMQAMEAVSKELPPPINVEFRRVVQEMQLGVPMEAALENLLRRIPSDDLDLVITAVNVQREVGGNLAEILETISYTIRERIRIKGEIRTLTAQVLYSGRFLSILPIIMSTILWALNREYMMQFFLEPKLCGIAMLVLAALMIIAGYFAMTRIADIEV